MSCRFKSWLGKFNRLLISCATIGLTACVALHQVDPSMISETSDRVVAPLVKPSISRWMDKDDCQRLQIFVETAPPEHNISWKRRWVSYAASSTAIFLNDQVQPCRCYQFKRASLLSRTMISQEVSCRNTKGQWLRMDSPELVKEY